jgi:hypothetical protein
MPAGTPGSARPNRRARCRNRAVFHHPDEPSQAAPTDEPIR